MVLNNKVVAALAAAAIVGLIGDHILVRGDLQEEIERSKIKDERMESWLRHTSELSNDNKDRVIRLEVREGIYHRDHDGH